MTQEELNNLVDLMHEKFGERRNVPVETKTTTFERHAQTILVSIITLIIGGAGIMIWEMKDTQSQILTKLEVHNVLLANLNNQAASWDSKYVPNAEYQQFRESVLEQLRELEERVLREERANSNYPPGFNP